MGIFRCLLIGLGWKGWGGGEGAFVSGKAKGISNLLV